MKDSRIKQYEDRITNIQKDIKFMEDKLIILRSVINKDNEIYFNDEIKRIEATLKHTKNKEKIIKESLNSLINA